MLAADPYPWPYDGVLDGRRLALVVAGVQPAWIERSVGAGPVAAVISTLASAFRSRGSGVVLLRHAAVTARQRKRGLPPVRWSASWDLAFDPEPGDLVVDAGGVDGFQGSTLDEELRRLGADHLVLCGYGAEAAVDSTLRSANDRGYECLTLTDAVAPFERDTGAHALASVTMSGGIFGAIAPSSLLLAALAAPASSTATPELSEAS